MTAGEFAGHLALPADAVEKLQLFADRLRLWNPRINLVAKSSLDDLWRRHMLDCAQLKALLPPETRTLVDLGSGAGFPGLVLAILGIPEVHLIEADQRKAVFLGEIVRLTGVPAVVHAVRIEAAPAILADVVTARALARLDRLVRFARAFLRPLGTCYFQKGVRWGEEAAELPECLRSGIQAIPSLSDADGVILKLPMDRS